MKINEVFNQLAYGELSQLGMGVIVNGELDEANYPVIVSHINLGLTALYKRFNLKEGEITVDLQPGQSIYPLLKKYAVTGPGNLGTRYIKDSSTTPFNEDINKIEKILTSTGVPFSINDVNDRYSFFTPTTTTIKAPLELVLQADSLPDNLKTTSLTVVYRANHPYIDIDAGSFDPYNTVIELPPAYLQALLLFIASRVNNPIGMTNEFHAGNSYAAKYEQECLLLEMQGLEIDHGAQNSRFSRGGYI